MQKAEARLQQAQERAIESEDGLIAAVTRKKETFGELQTWQREVHSFEAEYAREHRQPSSHCKLTRARRKVMTFQQRLPLCQEALAAAERRYNRHLASLNEIETNLERLSAHDQQLQSDNATNAHPVRVTLRIDAGFASRENIDWLI